MSLAVSCMFFLSNRLILSDADTYLRHERKELLILRLMLVQKYINKSFHKMKKTIVPPCYHYVC